ncbi:cation-transporting P-type ATPase [Streptomyces sp. RB6PN25]|uniref:Cation-transporting P-type ATPase n=1 Tax=Streptomyces humicola TaxID=2953240 RepID=A0ABT1PSJ3_9ACTN|nr:cation-transporting P-type ATPase [Streptomyces humicola]MCQ4080621.1 cation-transporting P-type ATPase [Streptomyces humicola]
MSEGSKETATRVQTFMEPTPEEPPDLLLRHLHASRHGLSTREAARRLVQYGPNELRRRGGRQWPQELARQVTHPLAMLLWVAAALSFAVGSQTVAIAVLLVILLNALFAFVQEMEAERAVETLAQYLPQHATVLRDGEPALIEATALVPGDIVVLEEGDRIAADIRLLSGAVDVDMSTLTGESVPVLRSAELTDLAAHRLDAPDLVFSGSNCTGGEAQGVVFATGMHTQLGRIAALSERVKERPSPLEAQVRRVAWLIACIAIGMAIAFVPVAMFGAGLSIRNSVVFAVGLLAGNVPEGLLPVITLALAVAVSALARRGALVKRLSAVETLGSTDVICTDKTGTLTENRMRPMTAWTSSAVVDLGPNAHVREPDASITALTECAVACTNAFLESGEPGDGGPAERAVGDPTEIALLFAARLLGADVDPTARERRRRHQYEFDPTRKLMSTLDADTACDWLHTKGAPESVLPRCDGVLTPDGERIALSEAERARITSQVEQFAGHGLRVLALARRALPPGQEPPARDDAERELCFLGLVTLLDPPRPDAAEAVARCHSAGIRIIVITGDHPLTSAAIARQVGVGGEDPTVINAQALGHLHEKQLDAFLADGREIVFARSSPEAKLHIAEALRAEGHVVAMTGDGVNDAPALRSADIGIAMGRSGTDVAREAATMVLTDDSFATIVAAIEAGRQVYDNVRKFIIYIFAHATPEVVPFLVFALAGGAVPLPLTVLQLLAFDVGTETLPSLALGREPTESGTMEQSPRPHNEPVIRAPMLVRAWLFLGLIVAALQMGGFFYVLTRAGWHPGAPTGPGAPLHHAYLQATTMSFLGMIAGQIGTAFAVRTQRASLRSIGVFSNPYLLAAIAAELVLAAFFVYAPPMQALLGTSALPAHDLALLLPYPVTVWGADELHRWLRRRTAVH